MGFSTCLRACGWPCRPYPVLKRGERYHAPPDVYPITLLSGSNSMDFTEPTRDGMALSRLGTASNSPSGRAAANS